MQCVFVSSFAWPEKPLVTAHLSLSCLQSASPILTRLLFDLGINAISRRQLPSSPYSVMLRIYSSTLSWFCHLRLPTTPDVTDQHRTPQTMDYLLCSCLPVFRSRPLAIYLSLKRNDSHFVARSARVGGGMFSAT